MNTHHQHTAASAAPLPPLHYDNTLPGLVDLYLAIDTIAQAAYTPDRIMDSISVARELIRAEITNRSAHTDLDVAAKLRLAAHLISDPATIWPEDAALLTDAISRLSCLRSAAMQEEAA